MEKSKPRDSIYYHEFLSILYKMRYLARWLELLGCNMLEVAGSKLA
jgi:hypothetical protein